MAVWPVRTSACMTRAPPGASIATPSQALSEPEPIIWRTTPKLHPFSVSVGDRRLPEHHFTQADRSFRSPPRPIRPSGTGNQKFAPMLDVSDDFPSSHLKLSVALGSRRVSTFLGPSNFGYTRIRSRAACLFRDIDFPKAPFSPQCEVAVKLL